MRNEAEGWPIVLKPAAQPAKFSWPATGVGPRCDVGTKVNEGAHPQDENQVWAVRTPSRRCETSHSGGEAEQQERRRCWHIGYAGLPGALGLSGVRGRRPRPEFVFNVICLVGQLVPVPGIGVLLAAGAGFSSIAGYRFACFAQNTADFRQFC
jgi:hypothetical protein